MSSSVVTWNALADSYDDDRKDDRIYHFCIDAVSRIVNRSQPGRVLDAGCGTGLTTAPVCCDGRVVCAADYSLESLRHLKAKLSSPRATAADICALPFASGYFSAVLCSNTLQHLSPEQQPTAIRELLRVLSPGGTLVLTVHHYSRAKQRLGWIKEGQPGMAGIDYIFRFTREDLRRLLPRASIAAIGLGTRFDRVLPMHARQLLAQMGYGHMLMAVMRV